MSREVRGTHTESPGGRGVASPADGHGRVIRARLGVWLRRARESRKRRLLFGDDVAFHAAELAILRSSGEEGVAQKFIRSPRCDRDGASCLIRWRDRRYRAKWRCLE